MLTSASGTLVKETKRRNCKSKKHFLSFLCIDCTTFNTKITIFAPLTSVPEALVNISHIIIVPFTAIQGWLEVKVE
jgi:hypothetical protein